MTAQPPIDNGPRLPIDEGTPVSARTLLAAEIDRHWLSLDHHGQTTARCTCGAWQMTTHDDVARAMGAHLLPFSQHVADALLASGIVVVR